MLYDFGASIGDVWIINNDHGADLYCDSLSRVEVIDTGIITINGAQLRYVELITLPGASLGISGVAVERIGMVEPSNPEISFLFPKPQDCDSNTVVDYFLYDFRCYQDDLFPVYNTVGEDCDYLITHAEVDELKLADKTVVKIFDVTGRETEFKPNTMLMYLYDDGTTERVFTED